MSEYAVMPLSDYTEACEAVREMAGTSEKITSDHLAETIRSIPTVPLGANIKYIIPATYTPKRADDGINFDRTEFTFTRESTSQMFYVQWRLQDIPDYTTDGYWVSTITWELTAQGNYNSMQNIILTMQGAGKTGNMTGMSVMTNMAKNVLTKDVSLLPTQTTNESGKRLGQLYKGLIIITDSTYTGKPILDETKLGQFFSNTDTLTEGW